VKIDVDNLGKTFRDGIASEIYSLSRYVTLSRMFHAFFNIYVPHLLEEEYPYAYTVLSGGDDVFIIMPWNEAFDFVHTLQGKFKEFCQNNPEIHFSSGIAIAHPSEPFSIVNGRANDALDKKAKETEGKNCIAYFDGVCFSPTDAEAFLENKDRIMGYVEDKECSVDSSFIWRMMNYVDSRIGAKKNAKAYGAFASIRYDLARNFLDDGKDKNQNNVDAAKFFLDKFDNYKKEKELKQFSTLLKHIYYLSRKSEDVERSH